MAEPCVEIASADDDMIATRVLTWSGLSDFWDHYDLDANHCFIRDVLEHCPSAWIDREEWDANFPGLSGVWHTVSTSNPETLKQEIEERIRELSGTEGRLRRLRAPADAPTGEKPGKEQIGKEHRT